MKTKIITIISLLCLYTTQLDAQQLGVKKNGSSTTFLYGFNYTSEQLNHVFGATTQTYDFGSEITGSDYVFTKYTNNSITLEDGKLFSFTILGNNWSMILLNGVFTTGQDINSIEQFVLQNNTKLSLSKQFELKSSVWYIFFKQDDGALIDSPQIKIDFNKTDKKINCISLYNPD